MESELGFLLVGHQGKEGSQKDQKKQAGNKLTPDITGGEKPHTGGKNVPQAR